MEEVVAFVVMHFLCFFDIFSAQGWAGYVLDCPSSDARLRGKALILG